MAVPQHGGARKAGPLRADPDGRGFGLHAATQVIGARNATAAEARLLEGSGGAAVLTMERIAYDDSGTPVEYGTHIYAAARYSFQMSLLTG